MGLFSSVKGEIKGLFIARPDEAKDHIIYKHPDTNIRKMTQLTVEADEAAVFFRDGRVVGTLTAGRHTLDSDNVPFLGMIVDYATGGDMFVSEVYFVNLREIPNGKFGGPVGDVRDPETSLAIGIRVFGTFAMRVLDPAQLITGLAGMRAQDNAAVVNWVKTQLLKTIRDNIAELVVKKQWPLLNVTSGAYTEEIEADVIGKVKNHLGTYGLEVTKLGDFVVSMKEEDEATLKKFAKDAAYSRMAGGFNQYAAGSAMMGAGEGLAKGGGDGGGAALGAGMGVGMAMAQAMGQAAAQPQARAPAPPAAAPAAGKVAGAVCGTQVNPGKFCAECGAALAPKKVFCSNCGAELTGNAKFCAECGTARAG